MLFRDPLLGWVLLLPLGLALALRALMPVLKATALANGFDLAPYDVLVMSGYLFTAPSIVGMVVGFLLLDERDARTLAALRVSPLSMPTYLAYRTGLPLVAGTAVTLAGYPLTGLAPLPWSVLLPVAAVAGLSAPLLALVIVTAAPNKVAGFAVVKLTNVIALPPMAAFFLPRPLQFVAGIVPTFWPMRALWSAAAGEGFVAHLVVGAIVGGAATLLLARVFRA